MAKKYLLYIHNPKFLNVENKSKLVNELLDNHFAKTSNMVKPMHVPQQVQHRSEPTLVQRLQPCCLRAKPCIHWQYNGEDAYVNVLTGDRKDVI